MDENPYRSPQDVGSRPTKKATIAIVVLVVASLPAALFCGGITCYSVGVSGELAAKTLGYEQNDELREIGWTVGIPVALVIMALIPLLLVWFQTKRAP